MVYRCIVRSAALERSLKQSEVQKQELRKRVSSLEASMKTADERASELEKRLQMATTRFEHDSEKETLRRRVPGLVLCSCWHRSVSTPVVVVVGVATL